MSCDIFCTVNIRNVQNMSIYGKWSAFFLSLSLMLTITSCQQAATRMPYYREDILHNNSRSDILQQIRTDSEGRERRCRTDICSQTTTISSKKGVFTWPEAKIGFRMYVLCPYAFQKAKYAYRDCILDPATANYSGYVKQLYLNWKAKWHDEVTDICPDPPMEETLRRLKQKLGQGSTWNEYLWALRDISVVIRRYGDLPVTYRDIIDIVLILYKAVIEGVQQGNVLPGRIMRDAFDICDFVLEHDIKYSSVRPLETIRLWLLETIGLLTEMLFPSGDQKETSLSGNYINIISTIVNSSDGELMFRFPTKETNASSPLEVAVNIMEQDNHVVHVMYLGHPSIVDSRVDVIHYNSISQTTDVLTSRPSDSIMSSLRLDNGEEPLTSESIVVQPEMTSESNLNDVTTQNSQNPVDLSRNSQTTINISQSRVIVQTRSQFNNYIRSESTEAIDFTTDFIPVSNTNKITKLDLDSEVTSDGFLGVTTTRKIMLTDKPNSITTAEYLTSTNVDITPKTDPEMLTNNNKYGTLYQAQATTTNYVQQLTEPKQSDPEWRTFPDDVTAVWSTEKPDPARRRRRETASDTKSYTALTGSLDIVSSIVYVSISDKYFTGLFTPSWYKPSVDATVRVSASTRLLKARENETRCTNINVNEEISRTGFSMDTWYINSRKCEEALLTSGGVICTCSSLGFFAIMGVKTSSPSLPDPDNNGIPDLLKPTSNTEKSSPVEPFRYRYQVYAASHVLRVTALIFLLLTLLTYGLTRKASRGVTTHILLHLCVSLVMLLIVFYVAETVADTELGCRVVNALRYYLVLVTLMWNAAEALHMYTTVINTNFSHFMVKASFVAWGMPLVGVAVVVGLDLTGFDGNYDSLCIFRCIFNADVAYYAYILPVVAILLHDVILYALVIRHLLHLEDNQCQDKGWFGWARLVGSITLTILLAIPWLCLAFSIVDYGYIDIDLPVNQGIYQIIFIVSVLLQALFIFTFYCGGNSYIRSRWRATFKPVMPHSSVAVDQSNKQSNNDAEQNQVYNTKEA